MEIVSILIIAGIVILATTTTPDTSPSKNPPKNGTSQPAPRSSK